MPKAALRTRPFPQAARSELRDTRLRQNIRHATTNIRRKTDQVTGELPDWQELRVAGSAIKANAMRNMADNLIKLEEMVTRAGGHVHWANDAAEARAIVVGLARAQGGGRIIKVKSITTDEIELNPALEAAGMEPIETDLADMIVQLGHDTPSHFLVPAIHKNRAEIRALFQEKFHQPDIGDAPQDLTRAARAHLRPHFLDANIAISGGNFAIAETGSVCVLESEGNGRMCLTLAKTLITIMGIEKVLPRWQDLEVFLQLLPRASTGERMNPYTSIFTGVRADDGPQVFHLVLLDNGRSRILADEVARETLHCIRCSRCLNVCPVYERTGGHAYGSMYQGPIGAILTPQLRGLDRAGSLPYASTLCGACQEACPVRINIPQILIHLRGKMVERKRAGLLGAVDPESMAMKAALWLFEDPKRLAAAQNLAHVGTSLFASDGELSWLPPPLDRWTRTRNFPEPAEQSFRAWWKQRERQP
jgi:L-lactate dehydrogenase complex protein LldF